MSYNLHLIWIKDFLKAELFKFLKDALYTPTFKICIEAAYSAYKKWTKIVIQYNWLLKSILAIIGHMYCMTSIFKAMLSVFHNISVFHKIFNSSLIKFSFLDRLNLRFGNNVIHNSWQNIPILQLLTAYLSC